MLILECLQGYYTVKIWPGALDLWPWKSIGFQILLRTKFVPSLVKIHWRMLILECSQGWYVVKIWLGDLDVWPWKSIGFQIFLKTKYVQSLVKILWRMLILDCSQGCYVEKNWPGDLDLWPWKSIGFQILLKTDGRTHARTEDSVTISHRNFVSKGIKKAKWYNWMEIL
jgi:hypothetical protein